MILPFIIDRGTNNSLTNYRTGAVQDGVTELRALIGSAGRAIRDVLFSDGLTSNGSVFWLPGTAGNVATSDFTVVVPDVTFPAALTGSSGFFKFSDTNGGYPSPGAGGPHPFMLYVDGGAALQLQIGGDTNRRFQSYGASQFLGKTGTFHVVRSVSGASATLYWNGVAITPDATTTGGTPPSWADAIITTNFSGANFYGNNIWKGFIGAPYYINAVLTATEVLSHAQSGRLPTWCEAGTGTATAIYTSNFSAGVDSWAQNISDANLQLTGNVDAISGVDDVLQVLASGAAKTFQIVGVAAGLTGLAESRRYEITFDYYAEAGAFTGTKYLGMGFSGTRKDVGDGIQIVEGSWQTGKKMIFSDGALARIGAFTTITGSGITQLNSGFKVYFKNIVVRVLGPIFKPVIQPGVVLDDNGSNLIPGLLTSGVTPITERLDARIRGTTNTNGNQQLLGATLIPTNYRVAIFARARTGTPTVKWGTVSAGAEWVAAVALSANWTELTMVNKTSSGGSFNVWVNSTTTDIVDTVIRIQRLD